MKRVSDAKELLVTDTYDNEWWSYNLFEGCLFKLTIVECKKEKIYK